MKGFIVYPTYRIKEGKAQVLLFGRLESGESFVTINDFRPYFWIKTKDKKKAEKILKEINAENIELKETDYKNFDDEPVTKVTLAVPREVPELKKVFHESNITCYEADIRFSYRYMIDKEIKGCVEIEGDAVGGTKLAGTSSGEGISSPHGPRGEKKSNRKNNPFYW